MLGSSHLVILNTELHVTAKTQDVPVILDADSMLLPSHMLRLGSLHSAFTATFNTTQLT